MKTVRLNGVSATVYMERVRDGGLVVCYMAPEVDGTFTAFRAWNSDSVAARAEYDAATAESVSQRIESMR